MHSFTNSLPHFSLLGEAAHNILTEVWLERYCFLVYLFCVFTAFWGGICETFFLLTAALCQPGLS